jgi:Domain of unknown function (DUF4412)
MNRTTLLLLLVASMLAPPVAAHGGWIAEWQNTASKSNGDPMSSESATMMVSKDRMRMVQPQIISIVDYKHGRYTILNPTTQSYWSGSIDDYIAEMSRDRTNAMQKRLGKTGVDVKEKAGKVDPASLPPVKIQKTGSQETIAGRQVTKYSIEVGGEPFQEIWVADDLDLSSDLDPEKYATFQRKMGSAMVGKAANQFNALYHSEEYRKLVEKSFILKSVTHHVAGTYERTATSIKETEVPDSEFEVPDSYRRVRLSDVFPKAPEPS